MRALRSALFQPRSHVLDSDRWGTVKPQDAANSAHATILLSATIRPSFSCKILSARAIRIKSIATACRKIVGERGKQAVAVDPILLGADNRAQAETMHH
jgi:hypothetical protein